MQLATCLEGVTYRALYDESAYPQGVDAVDITSVEFDSRDAGAGAMFCCFPGQKTDGHKFAASAYEQGCRVFMCEHDLREAGQLPEDAADAICVVVEDTRFSMAVASANFFEHPERELKIIGVTGTKGKTTITHMVQCIMAEAGYKVGITGSLGARIMFGDETLSRKMAHTTPEAPEIFGILRWMADEGVEYVAMEISSHALWQNRVWGIHYMVGVFTMMGLDHIGIGGHPNYEHYVASKKKLFSRCDAALQCADDPYSEEFRAATTAPVIETYSFSEASNITSSLSPFHIGFDAFGGHFEVPLAGDVTVSNAICAMKICKLAGVDVSNDVAARGLKKVRITGRFEVVPTKRKDVTFIIDFAHNRCSLDASIQAIRDMNPKRIVCLFSCIGDRMQLRRKEMAESVKAADVIILTTNDPGFEDPDAILDEIESYMGDTPHIRILDRTEAITWACEHAEPGDVVLFEGKGHEHFFIEKGVRSYYCERDVIEAVCGLPED